MKVAIFDLDGTLFDSMWAWDKLAYNFLKEKGIENIDKVEEWLHNNGGYCDCEVLMNVEEKFEWMQTIRKEMFNP